jgi:hypothetical protein
MYTHSSAITSPSCWQALHARITATHLKAEQTASIRIWGTITRALRRTIQLLQLFLLALKHKLGEEDVEQHFDSFSRIPTASVA